ncbi:hypothetical protein KY345_00105 [Candidatus Woesearchaeota archaeon]|nr:hypothetical protein [Candidatus Woesearchaeota archaeon]
MKFADKEFRFYWNIIEFPFYLLLLWTLTSFVISYISFSLYLAIFSWYSNLMVSVVVFGIVGWSAVKDHKASNKECAWSGALLGVIIGLVGAVTGIIMVYTVPAIIDFAVQNALNQGAQVSRDMIESMTRIGSFIGLVTGPLVNGVVGAVMAVVSGLIARKV